MAATSAHPSLTPGGIERAICPAADGAAADCEPLVLRVSSLARVNDAKWTAAFTDGSGRTLTGVLTTQAIQRLAAKCAGGAAGALGDGDVVRVSSYACISHANQMRLMAMSVEVLHRAVAGGAAAIGGGNGNGNGNGGGDDKGNGAAAAAGAAAGAAAAGHNAGGAPASPADGGAGGKDQAAAVTPARPAAAAAAAADDAAGPAVAPATAARPPAPTPGEQPRMTPGTLAAAGLAGVTPARGHAAALSPGPPPPTALAPAAAAAAAGGGGGGGGAIPVRAAGRPEPAGVVPIAALNPYESGCTIKAKVVRKNPLRSFSRGGGGAGGGGGGGGSSVFSCELADAQGGAIQATFWREAADRVHASLHEGRVYYFSRFSVKPSNRAYSAVRNDYELSFDAARGGCEVEEAADQQASAEAVALAQRACAADPVPVARLPAHVGRKAPVDVLALVLQVGPVGSVKRKADNAELARRDLVVGDSTGRSVVLTVWNALAGSAALERAAAQAQAGGAGGGGRPMVLQVTSVRVGDYNGCSLSTVARSELTAEPASAEADALREWWDAASAAGAPPAFSPLGAAAAGGDGAAGSRRGKITPVSEMLVPRGQEPAADAKPTYSTVLGYVASINADKDLYYLASAENGRKVTRQGDGRLWCEGDGKFVEAAEHRYIFLARVEDESGEAYLNVFNNDGARLLGGKTADELAAMRDGGGGGEAGGGEAAAGGGGGGGEDALRRVLKAAQWTPYVFTVQCKSREYNGDRRMRYSVMSAAPVDFREQAARMMAALNA